MVHLFAIAILMCASGDGVNEGPQPLGCQECDGSVGAPELPYDPSGRILQRFPGSAPG